MQTMEMGSAEAAMTQMPGIVPPASSSYFLQLDPSGHIDILESSLVLNKPEIPEETVYEIQLDNSFMLDQGNVEFNLQSLQQLQGALTFQQQQQPQQPDFMETHFLQQQQQPIQQTYATTIAYEPQPQQIQFHIDDVNFTQMLLGNNATIVSAPLPPPVPIQMQSAPIYTMLKQEFPQPPPVVVEEHDGFVPDFVFEHEILEEPLSQNQETITPEKVAQEVFSSVENETIEVKPNVEVIEEPETETVAVEKSSEASIKREIRDLPDQIMQFSEEAVIPPLVEISPIPLEKSELSPLPISVVDISSEEEDDMIDSSIPMLPNFLHEGIEPDDELYISFLSRPDASKTVMCVLCYEWFNGNDDLEEHLKAVHQDNMKLYACKRCGKTYWSRFLRQRHERQHRYDLKGPMNRRRARNGLAEMQEASHYLKRLRRAPFSDEYKHHLKVLHSEIKSMEYECFECGEEFRNEEEFSEHNEEYHAIQTCVTCRKTFENSKQLRAHELDAHGRAAVPKEYPGGAWKFWENLDCKELSERDNRIVDVYLHHNYSKKNASGQGCVEDSRNCDSFEADDWDDISSSKKGKRLKKRKTDKLLGKSVEGGENGILFADAISMGKNKKAKSKGSKPKTADKTNGRNDDGANKGLDLPFKCLQCRTSYSTETDLQRHLKTHTIRCMAYMCQYCGRGFATHSNRKEHERIHTGDKPYVCPICTRAFVQISNLKKHIQTHKDKNNLQCTQCQKQFVKESSLILHQRAHSQDRKFRCHVCDRAYNYASLLKRHMRIHTGENPYSCADCGMMFHELVSLHYHRKKVHTGERPHRCEHCDRAFILSSDLKKHLKIHDRDGTCAKVPTKTYSRSSKQQGKPLPGETNGEIEEPNTNGNILLNTSIFEDISNADSDSLHENITKTETSDEGLLKTETDSVPFLGETETILFNTDVMSKLEVQMKTEDEETKIQTNIVHDITVNHLANQVEGTSTISPNTVNEIVS